MSAGIAELFDLVGDGWTPPATVQVRPTRAGFTVVALYGMPAGGNARLVARIRRDRDGGLTQTEERMHFAFKVGGAT